MATSKLWKLVKLSVRLGVPSAAVYVGVQEGLWGSPEETFLFYEKVKEVLPEKDIVISKDQEEKLTSAFDKLRVWSHPNYIPLSERWNQGVIRTVSFLDSLPEYFSSEDSPLKSIEEKAKQLLN